MMKQTITPQYIIDTYAAASQLGVTKPVSKKRRVAEIADRFAVISNNPISCNYRRVPTLTIEQISLLLGANPNAFHALAQNPNCIDCIQDSQDAFRLLAINPDFMQLLLDYPGCMPQLFSQPSDVRHALSLAPQYFMTLFNHPYFHDLIDENTVAILLDKHPVLVEEIIQDLEVQKLLNASVLEKILFQLPQQAVLLHSNANLRRLLNSDQQKKLVRFISIWAQHEKRDGNCNYAMGMITLYGLLGVTPNEAEAVIYLTKAACLNHLAAQGFMGNRYYAQAVSLLERGHHEPAKLLLQQVTPFSEKYYDALYHLAHCKWAELPPQEAGESQPSYHQRIQNDLQELIFYFLVLQAHQVEDTKTISNYLIYDYLPKPSEIPSVNVSTFSDFTKGSSHRIEDFLQEAARTTLKPQSALLAG